jgi:hypothetical protein
MMRRLAPIALVAFGFGATGVADAGRGTAALKYLPDDVSMIVVADVAHARSSPLLASGAMVLTHRSPRWAAIAADVELGKLVDTYVVAATGPASGGNHDVYTIVDGKLDPIVAKLATQTTAKHAGITYYKLDDAEVAIVDKHLIVAPPGGMDGVVDRARGKAASAASSSKAALFRTALAASGSGNDVWGALVIDDDTRHGMASVGVDMHWGVFAIALASGATLDLKMGFDDDDAARAMADTVQKKFQDDSFRDGIARFAGDGFVQSVTIDRDVTTVRISGGLTADEVDRLARSVIALF